jgi:hypothetical protein
VSTSFKASFFSKKKPWLVAGERALRRRSQGPANVEGGEGLSDFAIPKMARGQDRRPTITNPVAALLRFLDHKNIRVRPRIANQGFDRRPAARVECNGCVSIASRLADWLMRVTPDDAHWSRPSLLETSSAIFINSRSFMVVRFV